VSILSLTRLQLSDLRVEPGKSYFYVCFRPICMNNFGYKHLRIIRNVVKYDYLHKNQLPGMVNATLPLSSAFRTFQNFYGWCLYLNSSCYSISSSSRIAISLISRRTSLLEKL
jgi:hypothetical protein